MTIVPTFLEPVMLTASYGLTIMLAAGIWWVAGRAGLTSAIRIQAWLVAMTLLVTWQYSGVSMARAGVFINGPGQIGAWMAVAIFLPVAVGLIAINAIPTAQRIVEAAPLWALVAIQFYRAVGAVFLALWAYNALPGAFALPAGIGDVAIGLAAPVVGYVVAKRPESPHAAAWWNALGIADLLVAISTAYLTSPGSAQLLALDAPNTLITAYPLALVPLYAVPVSLILHGLVWQRLERVADYAPVEQ